MDLFELRLGVYASRPDTEALADKACRLLDEYAASGRSAVVKWTLVAALADQPAEPGSSEELTVAGLYEELPEQWSEEHPGEDPGGRAVTELRVGLLGDPEQAQELLGDLSALACPDPEHSGVCSIPWSADFIQPFDEHYRAYLESQYGNLRSC
ncbi:hypothetical protein ACH4VS_25305 [Streptomyces hygroscopicus]|uniref:hypothetical protein n=1 Tax=Streptomyces hygroscopicus TaxID=1912 RepID=UPI0008350EB7|nr:hypothetical protein [Streptomyces hygroscopicus]GLV76141.1 hypothetical protein Shyhy02_41410 [Streptomyces hygroscopicus subsp. hygroscopicus]